jgi:hypothetical protein
MGLSYTPTKLAVKEKTKWVAPRASMQSPGLLLFLLKPEASGEPLGRRASREHSEHGIGRSETVGFRAVTGDCNQASWPLPGADVIGVPVPSRSPAGERGRFTEVATWQKPQCKQQ